MLKNQQNNRRVSVLFTLTALVVVLMSNVYVGSAQTTQSDTVWSKYIGSEVKGVKFSPDGQFIYAAAIGRKPMKLSTESGEILREYDNTLTNCYSLELTKDGKQLIVGGIEKKIQKINTDDGKILLNFNYPKSLLDEFYNFYAVSLSLSNDEGLLASVTQGITKEGDNIRRVIVWNNKSGDVIKEIYDNYVEDVKFSPNDNKLFLTHSSSGDNDISIYNTYTWEQTQILCCHSSLIQDISFSPEGSLLASCGWDGFIKIWDVKERKLVREFNYGGKITAIDFLSNDIVSFCAGEWPIYKCKILNLNNFEINGDNLINFVNDADYSFLKNYIVMDDGDGVLLLNLKRYLTTIDIDVTKTVAQVIPNPNSNQ